MGQDGGESPTGTSGHSHRCPQAFMNLHEDSEDVSITKFTRKHFVYSFLNIFADKNCKK